MKLNVVSVEEALKEQYFAVVDCDGVLAPLYDHLCAYDERYRELIQKPSSWFIRDWPTELRQGFFDLINSVNFFSTMPVVPENFLVLAMLACYANTFNGKVCIHTQVATEELGVARVAWLESAFIAVQPDAHFELDIVCECSTTDKTILDTTHVVEDNLSYMTRTNAPGRYLVQHFHNRPETNEQQWSTVINDVVEVPNFITAVARLMLLDL